PVCHSGTNTTKSAGPSAAPLRKPGDARVCWLLLGWSIARALVHPQVSLAAGPGEQLVPGGAVGRLGLDEAQQRAPQPSSLEVGRDHEAPNVPGLAGQPPAHRGDQAPVVADDPRPPDL